MNHLTEEELVERYYGAAGNAADAHLKECAQCAAALAVLEIDLSALRPVNVPERDENYADQMWARVEGALPGRALSLARGRRFKLWHGLGRGLAYAAGCAVLAAGGLVVLGDHLDRSERLLVELKHANADSDTVDLAPLPAEARSLLAANRVFRDEAEDEGDPGLTKALDHLDRLLTEIADRPGGLDAAEASRIRDEMNAEGLLFEVRVLRSKNPHRMKSVRVVAKGGAA
jgi:hypothetical protein